MPEQQLTPQYLRANIHDVESLARKLLEFSQTLSPVELALFMERIKRSLPNSETDTPVPLAASPEVFGAWINSIVSGNSRWFGE